MPRSSYVVNYLPQLIARGMNATQALNYLREQGLGIRTQTFYRAYGETRAALDRRESVQQARIDRRPIGDEVVPFSSRRATGFIYNINAAVRDRLTGEVYFTPTGYRTDKLVSFDRALQGALDALRTAQVERGSLQEQQVLGGVVDAVREFIPEDVGDEG